jgi:hypothetical protein
MQVVAAVVQYFLDTVAEMVELVVAEEVVLVVERLVISETMELQEQQTLVVVAAVLVMKELVAVWLAAQELSLFDI